MLDWLVYERHHERPADLQMELKAGFQCENDALQYVEYIAQMYKHKVTYVVKKRES